MKCLYKKIFQQVSKGKYKSPGFIRGPVGSLGVRGLRRFIRGHNGSMEGHEEVSKGHQGSIRVNQGHIGSPRVT